MIQPSTREESASIPGIDHLRVLVLFGGSELFGQERANLEVFRSLSELGLNTRFVTSRKWGPAAIQPELTALGFDWTTAPFGYQWAKFLFGKEFYLLFVNLWGVLATSFCVWREARSWQATHIYAANWLHWTYAALGIVLTGKPLIFRAGDQLPAHSAFHRWTGGRLIAQLACVICNSQFLANTFVRLGVTAHKLRVIYNRPPRRAILSPQPVPRVSPNTLLVVFVGQISKHKGAPLFVEAAKKIVATRQNAAFFLVGESTWGDSLQEELQSNVSEAGLERHIHFLGYRSDVPQILSVAHVHVCPSVSEDASPNVVLEAKKEGVPSVAFAVGGIPELIEHRVDGYICDEKTADALADGIDYFLRDESNRQGAGVAARRSLDEKFGAQRFRREWAQIFVATAHVHSKGE